MRREHLAATTEAGRQGLPSLVLVSRQLAPGVGGFPAGALLDLKQRVARARENAVIVSTASCCHGITSILV